MLKLTDLSRIMRIDFKITEKYCNSDGKPVVNGDTTQLSAIYNKDMISEKEVSEWIEKHTFENNDKILIIPTKTANTVLKNVFPVKDLELWIGFESEQNQERLEPEHKNKIFHYDAMKVFDNEQTAIDYRNDNPENREYKYLYIKAPKKEEVDYESV